MLILITGGSKCGKSAAAEKIITSYDLDRYYIATMQPFGDEAQEAVKRHRNIRMNKDFKTIERYTDIQELSFNCESAALLECIGNLCANEMFDKAVFDPTEKIVSAVKALSGKSAVFVVVTSQVGDDGIEYSKETMRYIENMGSINKRLADISDIVIECVYGIPVILKGEKPKCLY